MGTTAAAAPEPDVAGARAGCGAMSGVADIALMGIVNVTPDSFFDGGRHVAPGAATRHAERLVAEGASIVDVGAESTRPGAARVAAAEQIARVGSTIREVARFARVSIDTTDPEVAVWALEQGATMVNCVSLAAAAELGRLAATRDAELVLMHARGDMTSMTGFSEYPPYADVVAEVVDEWTAAAQRALDAGLAGDAIWFDPGIGFHKNAEQSLELLARLGDATARLRDRGFAPKLAVGTSRKSFIAKTSRAADAAPEDRLGGSIATALSAVTRGARLLRVHDVSAMRQALDLFFAIEGRGACGARRTERAP